MRLVVTHHAHHKDEGVYRLVYAEEHEHVRMTSEPNPDYDPEAEASGENPQTIIREETFVVHANHQDVVWADDDPRWKGMKKANIAAEQRKIISEVITQRVAQAERLAVEREQNVSHFDTGQEL